MATILLNKINIITYFKNLTVKLHVLYALNTLQILCQSYIIDNITIDLEFSIYFASIEKIKKRCNPMMNLSKFISNKKIY